MKKCNIYFRLVQVPVLIFIFSLCSGGNGEVIAQQESEQIDEHISYLDALLPKRGNLLLTFKGKLTRIAESSPFFADSIVRRLQMRLPEGIKLVKDEAIPKNVLGTIILNGECEKRSFKKITDAKSKYPFLEKSLPVKFYKVYSLEFKVKMNPIKSKIYKIWRKTNWDNLVVGEIVPLDRKSFDSSGAVPFDQQKWFNSSFWQKIPPFKFTGFDTQQYLYFQP